MKHEKAIEILVRGVCVKEGRLLVCQGKGAANTFLPGGHVEWQEKARDSLVREIREEMGCRAKVKEFFGAVEHTFIQKGERHCEINVVFGMDIPALHPDRDPEACEHWITFKWIPLSRLAQNHLEPWPLRKLIPGWLRRGRHVERWGSTV
jgi:ADP-ribose pyrophosphatase YjhB (NUDIX family)